MSRSLAPLLALYLALWHSSAATGAQGLRPWEDPEALGQSRADNAESGSLDDQVAHAVLCLREGRAALAEQILHRVVAADPEHHHAWKLLGMHAVEGAWRQAELSRYAEARPATSLDLPALSAKEQKRILLAHDRDPALNKNASSFFEMTTDLPLLDARVYAKALDRHFSKLKTRFRSFTGEPIQVLVFGKRSDYLGYYNEHVGAGGEHVLGFYYSDHLVFFDDRSDRANVINTARHECTHLLADRCYARARLPLWFGEGLACYLAADAEEAHGAYTAGLYLKVVAALRSNRHPSLDDLLFTKPEDFDHDRYAFAWSWFHFLNQDAHREAFQTFLEQLRDTVDAEMTAEACRKISATLLVDTLGEDIEELQLEWAAYFGQEFALEGDEQLLDFSHHCLHERYFTATTPKERTRTLEMATAALAALRGGEELLDARASCERLWLKVLRLSHFDASAPALRLAVRTILSDLRELPSDSDPAEIASLAARALTRLQQYIPTSGRGISVDGRKDLLDTVANRDDNPSLRSLLPLHDDLLRLAQEAFNDVFQQDPVHAGALNELLFLCVRVTPQELEILFPRLRLLVESDPADLNLAALALCYAAFGKLDYARHLMNQARQQSLLPAALSPYASYIEKS